MTEETPKEKALKEIDNNIYFEEGNYHINDIHTAIDIALQEQEKQHKHREVCLIQKALQEQEKQLDDKHNKYTILMLERQAKQIFNQLELIFNIENNKKSQLIQKGKIEHSEYIDEESYEKCSYCNWENINDEHIPQEGAPISGFYPVCPKCSKHWEFEKVVTKETKMVRITKKDFDKLRGEC